MKILSVRLQNLNSLKGEHLIRFDKEPLESAGLFAITGPTGAGKTTVLDAITLALYGKVARYGNESNPEHVMTRHCGECSAEVEFEVATGIYRAAWERHRAGKKPEGKLQAPKRYIYDAAGAPLAQQIREAEQKIESLLGLNYDRFLRSVLLAQGDFARFLKADANERAGLLESLTGTTIYSRLGKLAHEEANRREAALEARAAGLDQIELLEEDEQKQLTSELKTGEVEDRKLQSELEAGESMLRQIEQLRSARIKEEEAAQEREALMTETKAAGQKLDLLQQHRATLPFARDLANLENAEVSHAEAGQKLKLAEREFLEAKADRENAATVFAASLGAALAEAKDEEAAHRNSVKEEEEKTSKTQGWLERNKADEPLSKSLAEIIQGISAVQNDRESIAHGWSDCLTLAGEVIQEEMGSFPAEVGKHSGEQLEAMIKHMVGAAREKQEQLKKAGIEAKRQWELRKDHLEKSKLIASLDQHRADLKPGDPCPLCGSEEHPYAESLSTDTSLATLEAELSQAESSLEATREQYREVTASLKGLEKSLAVFEDASSKIESSLSKLAVLLKPFGTSVPARGEEGKLQISLQNRVDEFREQEKAFEAAKQRTIDATNRANQAAERAGMLLEKQDKFEIISPTDSAGVPPMAVPEAEKQLQRATELEKVSASAETDRRKDLDATTKKREAIQTGLIRAIEDSEFASLARLKDANLPTAEATALETLESGFKQRTAACEALQKQAAKEVAELVEQKVLEGADADTFLSRQGELKRRRDELVETQTTRRNRLALDSENRRRKEESEKALVEDKKSFAVWRRLKELIGSHDGAKFRRYAQSISLDILTRHANRHLIKLSDRYRISRDPSGELNLEIEDLHQAGTKRPMASLSGGESFLASLALALGLSDLAGRTVRIDSLFIDEGFGSLDPDSLEIAIATLESLQQDHKTVGIISHVDLLKERIGTQIVVEKQPGGVGGVEVIIR